MAPVRTRILTLLTCDATWGPLRHVIELCMLTRCVKNARESKMNPHFAFLKIPFGPSWNLDLFKVIFLPLLLILPLSFICTTLPMRSLSVPPQIHPFCTLIPSYQLFSKLPLLNFIFVTFVNFHCPRQIISRSFGNNFIRQG